MIIMKFGGTSVGDAKMIVKLTEIVRKKLPENPIVVVSAFSGITNLLIELAEYAVKERSTDKYFNNVVNRHYEIITELGVRKEIISNELQQLKDLIMGISLLQELTPRIMDNMLSFGERMSARIIAAYMLNTGLQTKAYDAFDIGMITTSEFGNADVIEDSYKTIKKYLSDLDHIPVITGFIGKDKEGHITTLGRGGSDYTATIIGAAMHAKEIEIWTDVNGIMTADPRIVKNAKSIDIISSDEASELAFLGAKVLHPRTILP
ncbi:MAG: aspartate kinase, partial [Candidatus Parvarchaeum sp.]